MRVIKGANSVYKYLMGFFRVIRGGVGTSATHFRQPHWLFSSQRMVGSNACIWNCSSLIYHSIPRVPDVHGLSGQMTRWQASAPLRKGNGTKLRFGREGGLSSLKSTKDGRQVVQPCHFSSLPLDRAGVLRGDGSTISDLLQQPDTKIVLFLDGGKRLRRGRTPLMGLAWQFKVDPQNARNGSKIDLISATKAGMSPRNSAH